MNQAATKQQEAADRILDAIESGQPCEPVRNLIAEGGVAAAYEVQEINTKRWLKAGRRLIGRKIGLTSHAVQRQLGVDQPDYGMLYADMNVADGEEIPIDRVMQPKVEAEVALVMGANLGIDQLTTADIISAVDYAVVAIEIVGSRIADWDIRITDTIADNASSGLFVLGNEPRSLSDFDPRLCGMVMERRGEPISVGAGVACLGNPVVSALWLARVMAKANRPLSKGDIVLTGALGPMCAVEPGDVVEARVNGLGSVRAAFAPAQ